MAISVDNLASVHRSKPEKTVNAKNAKPLKDATQEWGAGTSKDAFLNIKGSPQERDKRGRVTGGLEEKEVVITEALREQFRTDLKRYAQDLYELEKDRDARVGLEGESHEHDRLLLDKLKDPTDGGKITEKSINAFLSSDHWEENWTTAYLALQLNAFKTLSALGVKVEVTPKGVRNIIGKMPDETMRLGADESFFRKTYTDTIRPWATDSRRNTAGRPDPRVGHGAWGYITNAFNLPNWFVHPATAAATVGPIIVGALTANPILAATGLVAPTLTLLGKGGREGLTVEIKEEGKALKAITGTGAARNVGEIKFMSKMTGINLDNYDVDAATGKIVLRAGKSHEITKDPKLTIQQSINTLITGMEFLDTVGVPFKNIDVMFAQLVNNDIAGDDQYLAEQTGFKKSPEVLKEYITQGGFNPDFGVRAQRMQRAFAKVIARDMREQIDEEKRVRQRAKSAERLELHEGSLTKAEDKRKADAAEREKQLKIDKGVLDGEIKTVKDYRKEIEDFRQNRENKVLKSGGELNLLFDTVTQPGGVAFGDVAAMNTSLAELLNSPAGIAIPSVIIEGRLIQSTQRRLRAARTANAKAPRDRDMGNPVAIPPILPETVQHYDNFLTAFNAEKAERFTEAKKEIEKDIQIINDTLSKIKSANSPVQEKLPDSLFETGENVLATTRIFARQREDFADVTAWGITSAQLGTESEEALIERINSANDAAPAFGWPKHQNNTPANRQRLFNAIIEARAETISPLIAAPGAEFTRLTARAAVAGGGWEITENQILTLSSEQIRQLMIDRQTRNPATFVGVPLTLNEIEFAKDEANERLRARMEAMDQLSLRLDRDAQLAGAIVQEAPTKMRVERTTRLKKLMEGNQESILGSAKEIALNPNIYFNSTELDPANPLDVENHTPAERAGYNLAGVPKQYTKGYLEFMDIIFEYRKRGSSQEIDETFKEYASALTPDRIALAFDEIVIGAVAPLIGPPPLPRNDINLVFSDILTLANSRGLYSDEIQKVLQKIIGDLAGRTPIAAI